MINGSFFMPKKPRDFNQIPGTFKSLKPGDKVSFRIPGEELIEIPGELCTKDLEIPDIINLSPERRGREEGSNIIYDPDQTYNYLSVSERENRSFQLLPAYIREEPELKRTVYGFCSDNSPSGFWEVVVSEGESATFINFEPPFLTILCPRPFTVSSLTTLNSDSTVYKWTQISGSRTALIIPDNVKDPIIDIQSSCISGTGCNQNTQEPIRIRVDTDNPLIFADLIILNRATDNFDGLGYAGDIVYTQVECRKITTIYRIPNTGIVFLWQGTPITITWALPACDSEFITGYRVEALIPPYTDLANIPVNPRIAALSANTQYRLKADFSILDSRIETSISDLLIFRYDAQDLVKQLFADDNATGVLGYAAQESIATTDVPVAQVRFLLEDASVLGYANIESTYLTDVPGSQVRLLSEDIAGLLGFVNTESSYVITDLGGIVVG